MKRPRGWKRFPDRPAGTPGWRVAALIAAIMLAACSGSPSSEATGPELFGELCSACHGAGLEGKVGPALGPDTPSADLADAYLATSIRRGIGTMPSFDHLSDEQVSRIISFIRDVQAGG